MNIVTYYDDHLPITCDNLMYLIFSASVVSTNSPDHIEKIKMGWPRIILNLGAATQGVEVKTHTGQNCTPRFNGSWTELLKVAFARRNVKANTSLRQRVRGINR